MSRAPSCSSRARLLPLATRALWLKLGIGTLLLVGCAARTDVAPDDEAVSGPAVHSSDAIVHGAADGDRHPAVVALIAHDSQGEALCTASLIAPDVVLTARHCVSLLRTEYVDCPATEAQLGADRAPSSIDVVLGSDVSTGRVAAHGKTIFTPPGKTLCDADVALIKLDRPIASITPLLFAPPNTAKSGGHVLAVGFGKLGDAGDAGVRRFRTHVPITSVQKTEFMVGESTCSGDSGGPAFDEETGGIIGVVSRGGVRCDGKGASNVYTRVDPFFDLVGKALGHPPATTDPTPGSASPGAASDMGEGCSSASTCAGGVCVQGQYCSRHCGGTAGRCPAGYHCAPDASGGSAVCAHKS